MKQIRVEVIFGAFTILLSIHGQYVDHNGATLPLAQTWHHMEMGSGRKECFCLIQGAVADEPSASTLWPELGVGSGVWCINLWLRCCLVALATRLNWTTNQICILNPLGHRRELFPDRKRRACMRVWSNKIPRIHKSYGHFTLITDHKPLQSLLDGKHPVSSQASGRIQRWALKLSMYEYDLERHSTHQHGNADALSMLLLPNAPLEIPVPAEQVLLMEHLQWQQCRSRIGR